MSPVKLSELWREFEPSSDHPAHFEKGALIAVKGRDISKVTIYLGRRSRKNHRPIWGSGGDNQIDLVQINARPKVAECKLERVSISLPLLLLISDTVFRHTVEG